MPPYSRRIRINAPRLTEPCCISSPTMTSFRSSFSARPNSRCAARCPSRLDSSTTTRPPRGLLHLFIDEEAGHRIRVEAVLGQHARRVGADRQIGDGFAPEPHRLVEFPQGERLARARRPLHQIDSVARIEQAGDDLPLAVVEPLAVLERAGQIVRHADRLHRAAAVGGEAGDETLLALQPLGGRHPPVVDLADDHAVPGQLGRDQFRRDVAQTVQQRRPQQLPFRHRRVPLRAMGDREGYGLGRRDFLGRATISLR